MFRKLILACVALSFIIVPAALANGDAPSVAILRYAPSPLYDLTEGAILDVLQSYGYISEEERATLDERSDLEGEHIHIIWGDGNGYVSDSNLLVGDILGRGVDVIVTQSTVLAQLVATETSGMDEPPIHLFTQSYEPSKFGLAESSCDKADHITGSHVQPAYGELVAVAVELFPDISTIGTVFDPSEDQGAVGAAEIAEQAEALGLTVESRSATTYADLRLATQALAEAGVEALLVPADHLTAAGMPIIAGVAMAEKLPIIHGVATGMFMGAVISVGNMDDYAQGEDVGIMLANYLNGDIDIAATGIHTRDRYIVGINFDMAAMQNIEISDELRERAGVIFENGQFQFVDQILSEGFEERGTTGTSDVGEQGIGTGTGTMERGGIVLSQEERAEHDMAFLESLQCG